jgi:hypothetical protein
MNNQSPKKLPWAIFFGMMTPSYGAGVDRPMDIPIRDRWEFSTLFAVERKEGRQEGEKKAKIDIAREMLTDNVPLSTIVRYTGLTIEDIEALREGRV